MSTLTQPELDQANAAFWDHICGSSMATRYATIKQFDRAYLQMYPWLEGILAPVAVRGSDVLEVGPGYGTVGRMLRDSGCVYYALDIAPKVISHSRQHTIRSNAVVGNVLELDKIYPADKFDAVVAIGSLHHTGDVSLAVEQVHRVIKPGGKALVMLYGDSNTVDLDLQGNTAPFTEWVAADDIPKLFSSFTLVEVSKQPNGSRAHVDLYVTATK